MKTIRIIACWSGEYPWYLPYFIHSCQYNPSVEFVIVSDNDKELEGVPSNLKIIHKTLAEMEEIASQKLGFVAAIKDGYKLNDFKPAYGYIFSELIEGFDFWGHMDLDLIWGDLRYFLDEEMLSQYDFISTRHDYTTGVFCLYRNTPEVNTLFMRSRDYKKVLSEPKHYCFDECNFAWNALASGQSILDVHTEIESFTEVVKKAEMQKIIRAHFDFIILEGVPGKIVFDHGKIIYKNKLEALLYHFFWLKRVYYPKKIGMIPSRYWISPTRIYHHRR